MKLLLVHAETELYRMRIGETPADLAAAQRLRFEVFNLEMQEGLVDSLITGRDEDEFDAVCDHLLVEEKGTGRVVGTYRMQTGSMALDGLGFYSAREFEFAPFAPVCAQLVELGRACVAADHRNQTVLGLLWKGIAQYARSHGARYLVGCSSMTTQDEAVGLAAYEQLAMSHLVEPRWRTQPVPAMRCRRGPEPLPVAKVPRLMTAYLLIGAKICGEPAIDREFGSIDFLTWMDLETLPPRVLRKYLS